VDRLTRTGFQRFWKGRRLVLRVIPIDVRDPAEIEREVQAFAGLPNDGLIVTASAATAFHRDLIVTLAARHKLPAVYYRRLHVAGGGLVSYGADLNNQLGLAYVDRILKGLQQRANEVIE